MRHSISFVVVIGALFFTACASMGSNQLKGFRQIRYTNSRDTIAPKNISRFILMNDGKIVIADSQSLKIIREDKLLRSYPINGCSALLASDDTLFVGSEAGLFRIYLPTGELERFEFPARENHPVITGLTLDPVKRLWVATAKYGVFSLEGGRFHPHSVSSYVSSIVATRDTSVWAGTNFGIFRLFPNGEVQRYYEEIPANGIAIPDNIIEHMNTDAHGNMWIFMSQAVSVLAPEEYERGMPSSGDGDVDPHTFAFLGSPSNHIKKFIQPKSRANAWWAISTEGLFVASDVKFEDMQSGIPDKIEKPKANLRRITSFLDEHTNKNIPVTNPTDLAFDDNGDLWISTAEGLFEISSATLMSYERTSVLQAKK
ncbi:MAG: hypothetical protein WCH46_03250 [bacterium]